MQAVLLLAASAGKDSPIVALGKASSANSIIPRDDMKNTKILFSSIMDLISSMKPSILLVRSLKDSRMLLICSALTAARYCMRGRSLTKSLGLEQYWYLAIASLISCYESR